MISDFANKNSASVSGWLMTLCSLSALSALIFLSSCQRIAHPAEPYVGTHSTPIGKNPWSVTIRSDGSAQFQVVALDPIRYAWEYWGEGVFALRTRRNLEPRIADKYYPSHVYVRLWPFPQSDFIVSASPTRLTRDQALAIRHGLTSATTSIIDLE